MKLKNIGNKTVTVGTTLILPGETVEVSGEGFEKNDTLNSLVEMEFLSIVKEKNNKPPKPERKDPKAQTAPDPEPKAPDEGTEPDPEAPGSDDKE